MARNQEAITVSNAGWTELTNTSASKITFIPVLGNVQIRYTVGPDEPIEEFGFPYRQGETGERNMSISSLVADLPGADRVWAKTLDQYGRTVVLVDHA